MTYIDINDLYVVLTTDGKIVAADTAMAGAMEQAWTFGLGHTIIPVTRLSAERADADTLLRAIHQELVDTVNQQHDQPGYQGYGYPQRVATAPTFSGFKRFYVSTLKPSFLSGKKIVAIKDVRDYTYLSLSLSKQFVDWFWTLADMP